MKSNLKFLWLLIPVGLCLFIYFNIDSIQPLDLYEITDGYYLKKQDYFSDYKIVKRENKHFFSVVSNVTELSHVSQGAFVKTKTQSEIRLFFLPNETGEIVEIGKNNKSMLDNFSSIEWKKPWQFVETSTLTNMTKFFSQILVITCLVIVVFVLKKVFIIKPFPTRRLNFTVSVPDNPTG